jgi:protein-disulfide isomerase
VSSTKAGRGPNRARAVAAAKLARQRAAERKRRALFGGLIAGVVLLAAVIIGVAVYNTRDRAPEDFAVPRGATATGVAVGDADAKVSVDLYLDYQCPACKNFEDLAAPTLDQLVEDGTVKLVYHPIAYLNRYSTTEYSTRAAAAAGAAVEAGRFAEFTRILYANQPPEGGAGLSNDKLVELGRQAGVDSATFADDVRSQKFAGWVASLTEAASKRGVTGTPTVLVDGQPLETLTVNGIKAAVAKAAAE